MLAHFKVKVKKVSLNVVVLFFAPIFLAMSLAISFTIAQSENTQSYFVQNAIGCCQVENVERGRNALRE